MTALETAEETETSILALLNLLGMGMKNIPQPILQLKFSDISKILLDILAKHAVADSFAVIRPVSAVICLCLGLIVHQCLIK